ncbi:MAG: FtsQ-type POTRA domain-containing protein [Verrucomicrobia bacterium]|nr:FtsQ-type POTRA domain-containing protein [Verrucomicrobiota bacterium]
MAHSNTKNRRFERKHVLEVKVSSARRRQIWVRRLAMLLTAAGIVALGAFVIGRGGDWLLGRLIYTNPAFAIHTVEVETDGVLSPEQLRTWAGVRLRSNLMMLDLGRIKRDLELVPAIESVAVERVLPHTLRLRVTERRPVAQVALPNHWTGSPERPTVYTVDARGHFMFPIEAAQRAAPAPATEHLPVLVGIPVADLRPGRRTELTSVHAALRLLETFAQSPMAGRVRLRRLDVSVPGMLKVLTDQGSLIVFGFEHPETQLRRWAAVHQHGVRSGQRIAWMDLSVANNVPVRWQAQPPATNAPPTVERSSTQKHV